MSPEFGAFVISLDFELHWGVRDHAPPHGPYRQNLLGVWKAVPAMLRLFEEYEVSATWATVGLLFAQSRAERDRFLPTARPAYVDRSLDPFVEPVGNDERDDPLHYAPSLVAAIAQTPRQEVGTHTFSHFYCLEAGQTERDFRADLASAVAVARERGIELRSIVFPRNQHCHAYDAALVDAGLLAYRGNASGWMHRASPASAQSSPRRALRLVDALAPIGPARDVPWRALKQPSGLYDVAASAFLRPVGLGGRTGDELRFNRLAAACRAAARRQSVFHLWWHPHNFGIRLDENLAFLRRLLDVLQECRASDGMQSMGMLDVARTAKAAGL